MLRSLVLLAVPLFAFAQKDWNQPFPPHQIADNLYYAGSRGLSTYIVQTPEGLILINPSMDATEPILRANMQTLGLRPDRIRIILISHAHGDHVQGTARWLKSTGAKLYVMEGDDAVMANGGRGQYFYKETWPACHVDRVLKDGDTVSLGGVNLVAHKTPGHTRGCTTWTTSATWKGKPYRVVIVGSPNVNSGFRLVGNRDYPEIASDYARTFEVLKALPCDIFLGAHGAYYGMEEKVAKAKADMKVNPFVDPVGYKAYVADREQAYRRELARQQAGSGRSSGQ